MAPRAASSSICVMAGLLACSLSRAAAADPTRAEALDPGPPLTLDSYPPPAVRTYTIVGGLATMAGSYGAALGASYIWPDTVGAKDLRIPLAGPWIALGHSGCGPVADCQETIVFARAFVTALDGIGQIGGLLLAGQGLFLSTQEPKTSRISWKPFRGETVEMQPTFDAGENSVGFGVAGVF